MNEKRQFIDDMFLKLENVPVEEIVGSRVALKRQGSSYLGLCPFHQDKHLGSFIVTPSKGIWKCFVCGDGFGGNGISFVSRYDNISYLEAAFKVAFEKGLISLDNYEKYTHCLSSDRDLTNTPRYKNVGIKKSAVSQMADIHVRHNVYTAFKEVLGLSEEHLQHLADVRHLSKERLAEDYFSFPTTVKERQQVIAYIKEKYPEYDDTMLLKVPGFYKRKKKSLDFYSTKGIGFAPCCYHRTQNGNELLCGAIQIRRDKLKSNQSRRYTWFSSSFVQDEPEKYEAGGVGCHAEMDVLFPKPEIQKPIITIVEGRFKSEVLRAAGNISISVQGVSVWKGIDEQIKAIMENHAVSKIFVFYDSDMLGNTAVFKQAIALSRFLKMMFPSIRIYLAVWKLEDGKGVDDVFFADNQKNIQYYPPEYIAEIYESVQLRISKKYPDMDMCNNTIKKLMQEEMEDILFSDDFSLA